MCARQPEKATLFQGKLCECPTLIGVVRAGVHYDFFAVVDHVVFMVTVQIYVFAATIVINFIVVIILILFYLFLVRNLFERSLSKENRKYFL